MKAVDFAVIFVALALLSFALFVIVPVLFEASADPQAYENFCPDQQPSYCTPEPSAECLRHSISYGCTSAKQFLFGFTLLCLLISAVLTAYHFLFEAKIRSGSRRP